MSDMQMGLNRFLAAYRIELRFLTRNWLYLGLQFFWLGLLLYVMGPTYDDRTAQVLLETSLGRMTIGLTSLVALFVAGISATRSKRLRFTELDEVLPTGLEVVLGRWLAGIMAVAGFLVGPLLVAAYQGPAASFVSGVPIFVGEAVLTIAFTTAAAWWLNGWIKLGRWAYPLLVAGWAVFFLTPNMLSNLYKPLMLMNFMRQGTVNVFTELYGRLIYGDLFLYFNLFYLGLLMMLLGLIAWLQSTHRFYRWSVKASVLILAALGVATFAGWGYMTTVRAGEEQANGQWISDRFMYPPVELVRSGFMVEEYNLKLDLSEPDRPLFQVRMRVYNADADPISYLNFFLYPGFNMEESDLPAERKEELLTFRLPEALQPGESREIQFSYSGRVWRTEFVRGTPVAMDFVHPNGVRLSPAIGWYPLPVANAEQPYGNLSSLKPARVRLIVSGNDGLNFGSNLPKAGPGKFHSEDASWIFLFGSPQLVEHQDGMTTLITARNDLPRVKDLFHIYSDVLDKMLPFFPGVEVEGLTLLVLGEESGLPANTPPSDKRLVVVISRWVLASLEHRGVPDSPQYLVWHALMFDLWELFTGQPGSGSIWVANEIMRFIWTYHQAEGDAGTMESLFRGSYPAPAGLALTEIYRNRGLEGVIQAIEKMGAHTYELWQMDAQQFEEWIVE